MVLMLLDRIYRRRIEIGEKILASAPPMLTWDAPVHGLVIAMIMVTFYMVFHHYHGINLFSFHPTFMTLGFAFCISEGLLAYRNELVRKRGEGVYVCCSLFLAMVVLLL